jgi:hypothetical protein
MDMHLPDECGIRERREHAVESAHDVAQVNFAVASVVESKPKPVTAEMLDEFDVVEETAHGDHATPAVG